MQYGDSVNLTLTASDPNPGDHLTVTTSGVPNGLVMSGNGDGHGTVTDTIKGTIQVPAGSYPITFSVTDGQNQVVTQTFTITVTQKVVTVQPASSTPVSIMVKRAGDNLKSITLRATVQQPTTGFLGSAKITPVSFTLKPMGSGTAYNRTATVSGTAASATAKATFYNLPVGVYRVIVNVGGSYYTGAGYTLLTVAPPRTAGSISGDGTVMSHGAPADFSLTAIVQKTGKVHSSFLYVEHHATGDVTMRGRVAGSVIIQGRNAYFQGSATINGVKGYRFAVAIHDNGNPDITDQYAQWVIDSHNARVDGCTFSSTNVSGGDAVVTAR